MRARAWAWALADWRTQPTASAEPAGAQARAYASLGGGEARDQGSSAQRRRAE